jgi:hypothetical protein
MYRDCHGEWNNQCVALGIWLATNIASSVGRTMVLKTGWHVMWPRGPFSTRTAVVSIGLLCSFCAFQCVRPSWSTEPSLTICWWRRELTPRHHTDHWDMAPEAQSSEQCEKMALFHSCHSSLSSLWNDNWENELKGGNSSLQFARQFSRSEAVVPPQLTKLFSSQRQGRSHMVEGQGVEKLLTSP